MSFCDDGSQPFSFSILALIWAICSPSAKQHFGDVGSRPRLAHRLAWLSLDHKLLLLEILLHRGLSVGATRCQQYGKHDGRLTRKFSFMAAVVSSQAEGYLRSL